MPPLPGRRVVITSLSALTPLSPSPEITTSYTRLLNLTHTSPPSSYPFKLLTDILPNGDHKLLNSLPAKVAGCIPQPNDDDILTKALFDDAKKKHKSRTVQLALITSSNCLKNANLPPTATVGGKTWGVCIGTGIGELQTLTTASNLLHDTHSAKKLSPHFVPTILSNSASGSVSIEHNILGPVITHTTACASGAHSVSEGFRTIKYGYADVMLCGGSESCITELSVAGFTRIRALSNSSDVSRCSMPFSEDRDGFVMSEGCGMVLLESLDKVVSENRQSSIICEMHGSGVTGDAHHATSPSPKGSGGYRAMCLAMEEAGVGIGDISYINAHATSTPIGDNIETLSISNLIAAGCNNNDSERKTWKNKGRLFVNSNKGHIGHMLGAAGAVELAFTCLAVRDDVVPHTLNLTKAVKGYDGFKGEYSSEGDGENSGIVFVKTSPVKVEGNGVEYAICNSFGFGGVNCSILVGKYKA